MNDDPSHPQDQIPGTNIIMTDSTPSPTPKSRGLTPNLFALSIAALVALSFLVGLLVSTKVFTLPVHYPDTFAEALGGAFLVSVLPFLWLMIRRFDYRRASGPLQLWATLAILFGAVVLYGHWAENSIQAHRTSQSIILPTHDVGHGIKMPFPKAPSQSQDGQEKYAKETIFWVYNEKDGLEYAGSVMHTRLETNDHGDPMRSLREYAHRVIVDELGMHVRSSQAATVSAHPAYTIEAISSFGSHTKSFFIVFVFVDNRIHSWLVTSPDQDKASRAFSVFNANHKRIQFPVSVATSARIRSEFSRLAGDLSPAQMDIDRQLAEELLRVTATVNDEMRLLRSQLQEIGFPSLLDPTRLAADKNNQMSDSFRILDATEALNDRQIGKARKLLAESRNRLEEIAKPLGNRKSLLETFDRSAANMESFFFLEQEIFSNYRKLLEVLSRNSTWAVINEQVLFGDELAMNQFNQHMIAIQQLTEQQQETLRRSATYLDRVLREAETRLQ